MRLLLSFPVALVLAGSATAPALAAEFDRVCETHAEGADPDDIALPDSRLDVVVIRVAKRDRAYVALQFDPGTFGEQDGQSSVRFHACPPDTKRFSDGKPLGEWTAYPGGLIVERRRCVTLEFLEAGKPTVRRRVGIGRRCR